LPSPSKPIDSEIEMLTGNLCDIEFCKLAVAGAHTVIHFAANMGGMGVIHSANDDLIYAENHTMTMNLVSASVHAEAKKFLYASSACVYPNSLQEGDRGDVSLRESDVFAASSPHPQGLYGLEKLNSELLLSQYENKIQIHIARFHNIYGPGGAWNNGREKVPAAMLRKAFAAGKLRHNDPGSPPTFEIWGTGRQRRSFLFIDDAVKAILKLLETNCSSPVNIGSDSSITIQDLATVALQSAGIQPTQVRFQYENSRPVGVGSRNSNNEFAFHTLGWEPETSLEEGMRQTGLWIEQEIEKLTEGLDNARRLSKLRDLQSSAVVNLSSDVIRFAILLPITSRGLEAPGDCLTHLTSFARSLNRTTWKNTHELGSTYYRVTVYLSIDHDDHFLLSEKNSPKRILQGNGIFDVITLEAHHAKGDVCSHWRDCAHRAWTDGCDYFVLMGDDVVLQDEGWMEDVHAEYLNLASRERVPQGFGCVAFTDTTFPGMPTFPVINKIHMDIFSGEVVPNVFINQDGDPYLFQLYRRWGCSQMIKARITNSLGGSGEARYEKKHAAEWTFDTLNSATAQVDNWLSQRSLQVQRKLTLDVVIPCYRVNIAYLDPILNLKPSHTCSVMFIIIVDDPTSPSIKVLEQKYQYRPDVRIRVNEKNVGASASRNRGLTESSAEWVHFLDDDVSVSGDLLLEAEKAIRKHPKAAGFVGNSQFPLADNVFTTAVHLAGVTYFWDISTKMGEDLPWGVTANLIARRNVKDGVNFDLEFPKTGGGEDIDFCRKKRDWSIKNGGEGFWPAPEVIVTHPWWYDGKRTYWRFFGWSRGDGALVKRYPEFRYTDAAPNSAETLFGCAAILFMALVGFPFRRDQSIRAATFGTKAILAILTANIIHDLYRHLWRDSVRTTSIKTSIGRVKWLLAVLESSLIRIASEMGRTVGMLERREVGLLGKRFDWFTARAGPGPKREERSNALQRFGLFIAILSML
jgi:nucleoside-diphosphate-sugar epimerase/glycosyltransferase involved in cell wall biosynthesis